MSSVLYPEQQASWGQTGLRCRLALPKGLYLLQQHSAQGSPLCQSVLEYHERPAGSGASVPIKHYR